MTEQEWLACKSPKPMLEFLEGKASHRKLRLFACACCHHPAVRRLLNKEARALVDVADRFAEGHGAWEDVLTAAQRAPKGGVGERPSSPGRRSPASHAERAAQSLAEEDGWEAAWEVMREGANLLGSSASDLLRDIMGNPFRSASLSPGWRTAAVIPKAQAIYEDRSFERLPDLAEALEEAGCDLAELLAHLRAAGPHLRGCWALDLILGKK
jgi:hypothetical protein